MIDYLRSTTHPWVSFLFITPLLAVYEGGVYYFRGDRTFLAAQADAWVREWLQNYGAVHIYAAPIAVVLVLLLWSWWRWSDRPTDPLSTTFGMAFESTLFAFLLWQISRNFLPILDQLGITLELGPRQLVAAKVIMFIGAGIYEEVLFRLGLFSILTVILRLLLLPGSVAWTLGAIASSLAFAAAHHLGDHGEPMQPYVFLFRFCAGLYFALLFTFRGFGIAVGAHVGYDILVGVNLPPAAINS